jgi:hypothetical protein
LDTGERRNAAPALALPRIGASFDWRTVRAAGQCVGPRHGEVIIFRGHCTTVRQALPATKHVKKIRDEIARVVSQGFYGAIAAKGGHSCWIGA